MDRLRERLQQLAEMYHEAHWAGIQLHGCGDFECQKTMVALAPQEAHVHTALCIGRADWPDCLAPQEEPPPGHSHSDRNLHADCPKCVETIEYNEAHDFDRRGTSTSALETIEPAPEVKGELNSERTGEPCSECGGSRKVVVRDVETSGGRVTTTNPCPSCTKGEASG